MNNPTRIEVAFLNAIARLAEEDPDSCRWLLSHASYLEPEIDVAAIAYQRISQKLADIGFEPDSDFRLAIQSIHLNPTAKAALLDSLSAGDRILLEEIFKL
jgi:hypothetical protein